MAALLAAVPDTHVLRDPTRGGLATALCEIAVSSNAGIRLDEAAIPVREEVRGACELLGFDPLYVACEGRFLAIVPVGKADAALAAIRSRPGGEGARRIGSVVADDPGRLVLETRIGSHRLLERLSGRAAPADPLALATSMHEYSLVAAMVDRVEKEARERSAVAVHRLGVRIGALSGVEPELFASAFTLCRQGLLENGLVVAPAGDLGPHDVACDHRSRPDRGADGSGRAGTEAVVREQHIDEHVGIDRGDQSSCGNTAGPRRASIIESVSQPSSIFRMP